MKIALVCPYDFAYPGGVAVHIAHLAEEFTKVGHNVKILAPSSARPPDMPHYENLISLGRPVPVPSGGSTARVSLSIWLQPRLKAILKQERFDIVHLHEPLAPILPLTILHVSTAVNVGTFHAFHGSRRIYWLSRYFLRRSFNKLDGHIAVSKPALDFVSKYFPGDYQIIPNGVDVNQFANNTQTIPELRDDKINILFVGRLREKRKGLRYLLGAYSQLKWRYPNIRLIVVGPGQPDEECTRLIDERNARDVIFAGNVSFEDLACYYRTSDIFCAPNIGKESFGIILLEAMAAKKPIVATSIEGFSYVMQNGSQGFLVPPRDEEALANALEILIKDPALRKTMGSEGFQRAQQFHWPQIGAQILEYYEILLQRRKKPSQSLNSTTEL
jgi:phosphatidylinositol alpha-mannosyltransferase